MALLWINNSKRANRLTMTLLHLKPLIDYPPESMVQWCSCTRSMSETEPGTVVQQLHLPMGWAQNEITIK
jgi:hypothetical protein